MLIVSTISFLVLLNLRNKTSWSHGETFLKVIRTRLVLLPSYKSAKGCRSGECTRLPPVCPKFDSQTRHHMWVSLVLVLYSDPRGFSPGILVFPSPQNPTFYYIYYIFNNYSPKWRWIVVDMNNCFSIYHTSRISSGPKGNFICENIPTKAILSFFCCSEVNSTWLITFELANQLAQKVLFTCVVYTKLHLFTYLFFTRSCWENLHAKKIAVLRSIPNQSTLTSQPYLLLGKRPMNPNFSLFKHGF